jgi:hypothetical protein
MILYCRKNAPRANASGLAMIRVSSCSTAESGPQFSMYLGVGGEPRWDLGDRTRVNTYLSLHTALYKTCAAMGCYCSLCHSVVATPTPTPVPALRHCASRCRLTTPPNPLNTQAAGLSQQTVVLCVQGITTAATTTTCCDVLFAHRGPHFILSPYHYYSPHLYPWLPVPHPAVVYCSLMSPGFSFTTRRLPSGPSRIASSDSVQNSPMLDSANRSNSESTYQQHMYRRHSTLHCYYTLSSGPTTLYCAWHARTQSDCTTPLHHTTQTTHTALQ